jgi:hypothetical protein
MTAATWTGSLALPTIEDLGLGHKQVMDIAESPSATYALYVATAGGQYNMIPSVRRLILNPAGTIATFTVTLPPGLQDGQRAYVRSTQTVTAATIQGYTVSGTLQTVTFIPTGLAQDITYEFVFIAASSLWI